MTLGFILSGKDAYCHLKNSPVFFSRNYELFFFFLNAVLHAKRCVAFTGFKPMLLEGRLKGDHHAI